MIRKDSDVSDLTEFEIEKRIGARERQVRRLEKELKILRRVGQAKKITRLRVDTLDRSQPHVW